VAQYKTFFSGCASAHHVLVAATDIGGDDFKNNAVIALAVANGKLGVSNGFDGDFAGAFVNDTAVCVAAH
jgi:alkylation response protein AidB-like acyl-CoA dehydrogenase